VNNRRAVVEFSARGMLPMIPRTVEVRGTCRVSPFLEWGIVRIPVLRYERTYLRMSLADVRGTVEEVEIEGKD